MCGMPVKSRLGTRRPIWNRLIKLNLTEEFQILYKIAILSEVVNL